MIETQFTSTLCITTLEMVLTHAGWRKKIEGTRAIFDIPLYTAEFGENHPYKFEVNFIPHDYQNNTSRLINAMIKAVNQAKCYFFTKNAPDYKEVYNIHHLGRDVNYLLNDIFKKANKQ